MCEGNANFNRRDAKVNLIVTWYLLLLAYWCDVAHLHNNSFEQKHLSFLIEWSGFIIFLTSVDF